MYIGFYNSIGNNTSGTFLKLFTWQKPSFIKSKNSQQQQQHFTSPHNIQEIKIYNNSTDDDRALAARNNLRVKNARQPVNRKDV